MIPQESPHKLPPIDYRSLLWSLPADSRSQVSRHQFSEGSTLFEEGEENPSLHIIEKGYVATTHCDKKDADRNGNIFFHNIHGPGEPIGISSFLPEGILALEGAETLTAGTLFTVPPDVLHQIPRNSPIYQNLQKHFSENVRHVLERQKAIDNLPVDQRVRFLMLQLLRRFGIQESPTSEVIRLDIGFSQNVLARLAGATRETVSRVLPLRDGIRKKGDVYFINPQALV